MRAFLPLAAALALQGLAPAQIVITDAPKPQEKAPAAQPASEADNLFYKAFYLDVGARQFEEALDLYKKFLAAAPDSRLAPRAARNLVNLLYRTEKTDEARAMEEKYKEMLAAAPPREGPPREGPPREGPPRRAGEQGGAQGVGAAGTSAEQIQRFEAMAKSLEERIAEAKQAGDNEQAERLTSQLERIKTRIADMKAGGGAEGRQGGPGRQGGEGRQGGRGMMRPFADMTKEEAMEAVERMGQFLDRMKERMDENQAKQLEDNFAKLKELVKEGKLAEADQLRQQLFPGRQGGPGGRGMMRPFTDMTKEEAMQAVEQVGQILDRMKERLDEQQAKELEDNFAKLKELVKEGKLQEAEQLRQQVFRRRN